MLAIRRMKARKKKKKKRQRRRRRKERKKGQKIVREREQKSLGIVGPRVCVASPRWHRLHSLFTNDLGRYKKR
jgi:hypothetical protein